PEKSASLDSVRNPQSLKEFERFVL
ncbi:MAG: hypothetical protein RL675_1291, partial [Bacteroidota bacterium]